MVGPDGVKLENTTVRPQGGQVVMTTATYRPEGSTLVELERTEERFDRVLDLPEDAPPLESGHTSDC